MSLVSFRPGLRGMARPSGRQCFFALYVAGCASVASATGYAGYGPVAPMHVPHAVQIVLGLLMVFVVPGWSLVWAALPGLNSWVERVVASVGISVIVATCAAVLLAATPIGFSRQPFGELLGGIAAVLSNLVSNAVRYTPAGGSITIRWQRTPEGAAYSVSDTGFGIPATHLARLTERFYRISSSRSRNSFCRCSND